MDNQEGNGQDRGDIDLVLTPAVKKRSNYKRVAGAAISSKRKEVLESLSDGNRNYLSSGDISAILGMAPRCVQNWFDNGMISGILIPGSNHRRVERVELVRFMKAYNLPVPIELADPRPSVLLVGLRRDQHVLTWETFRTEEVPDALHAARQLALDINLDAVVIDLSISRRDALNLARFIASNESERCRGNSRRFNPPAILFVACEDETNAAELLEAASQPWGVARRPLNEETVVIKVRELLDIRKHETR